MIKIVLLVLAAGFFWPAPGRAAPAAAPARPPSVCRSAVLHTALLSPEQLCARPLAMARVEKPRRGTLRT